MKSVLKNVAIAPKKLNVVAGIVRGQSVEEALKVLRFMNKKAAKIVYQAIKSASSNAVHNGEGTQASDLQVSSIYVGKGMKLKRYRCGSRGMAERYTHTKSHLFVNLS